MLNSVHVYQMQDTILDNRDTNFHGLLDKIAILKLRHREKERREEGKREKEMEREESGHEGK